MDQNNLTARGQEAKVQGYAPLNLDMASNADVPNEFEFEGVFGDIIMLEVIDENEHGEVYRDGIWLKQDVTKKMWRRGRVSLIGPQCNELKIGDEVAYPSDRGLKMVNDGGKKFIFMNMERLFGKLKPLMK